MKRTDAPRNFVITIAFAKLEELKKLDSQDPELQAAADLELEDPGFRAA